MHRQAIIWFTGSSLLLILKIKTTLNWSNVESAFVCSFRWFWFTLGNGDYVIQESSTRLFGHECNELSLRKFYASKLSRLYINSCFYSTFPIRKSTLASPYSLTCQDLHRIHLPAASALVQYMLHYSPPPFIWRPSWLMKL